MHQDKDRIGKWLIGRYGDTILKLVGIRGFTSWKHVFSEVVAPRRQLDGLLEVRFPNEVDPRYIIIEVETYPDASVDPQVLDDVMLVAVEHRQIPEVVSIILKPKGNLTVAGRGDRYSPSGTVRLTASWPVVRLWEIDAEALFADGDVGLIPWIPLTLSDRSPEEVITRCVELISTVPDATRRSALLAATMIFTELAYPKNQLDHLFGGIDTMIESPIFERAKEIVKQRFLEQGLSQGALSNQREAVLLVLETRFATTEPRILDGIQSLDNIQTLKDLNRFAVTCPTPEAFLAKLEEYQK